MAGYSLIGSYTTVQVLSPTVVTPIEYCTIQTSPSGVIASIPVDETEFTVNGIGPILIAFAEAIETVMSDTRVISGVGNQTIDANGLLADNVTFTVQYTSASTPPSGVTAEALVPVELLNFSEEPRDQLHAAQVEKIIGDVYDVLKAAAGD